MKATAISPANIAFIKYWGRKDHKLFLPLSTTNSMNLSSCKATTTIEFSSQNKKDTIVIIDTEGNEKEILRESGDKDEQLYITLDRVREVSGQKLFAKVVSKLNFPLGAGIASSAAGMSAFVAAAFKAVGMNEKVDDRKELSREVRLSGSVSAARSAEDGFTELLYGETHEESCVEKIANPDHWDLVDIIAVVAPERKKISTSLGHEIADTSPFLKARVEYLKGKPELIREAILNRDFKSLAKYGEMDGLNMHAVMMTSSPMALYFAPGSIDIIKSIINLRESEGVDVFFTFDAGPNAHLITTKKDAPKVQKLMEQNSYVQFTIQNEPCEGVRIIEKHIF